MKRAPARTAAAAALASLVFSGAGRAQEPAAPQPPPAPTAEPTPAAAPEPTPAPATQQEPAASATPAPTRPVLELTLDEVVKRALENNVAIASQRYEPELSAQSVRSAAGVYDPLLSSTVSRTKRTSQGTSSLSGGDQIEDTNFVYNFGVSQLFKTGAQVDLAFDNSRETTSNVFTSRNPTFSSNLQAALTQPLLKNFSIDSFRQNLRVARKNREISDVQFKQTVANTIAGVKRLYYDLLATIDNLDAQRKSLDLAKKLLNENQIKVRVGTMAPLDVVAAESEVASREEGAIVAEAAVGDAEDALRREIFPKSEPEMWAYQIVPKDRPTAEPIPINTEAALASAMQNRTDLQAARKNLETADYTIDFTRNQLRPQFDLVAGYGISGIGGTIVEREQVGGLPIGPVINRIPGGYGDALSSVFGFDNPTWNVGVNFTFPIGNRQAKAANATARINKDQALVNLRSLELQVASEIRTAGRAVDTNIKRVGSTRAARVLAERRLDAEQKRFNAGMSTNFLVTQAQRDLSVAEVAEIRAIADYRNSLVEFERVQEAGTSGVSIVSSGTGGR